MKVVKLQQRSILMGSPLSDPENYPDSGNPFDF